MNLINKRLVDMQNRLRKMQKMKKTQSKEAELLFVVSYMLAKLDCLVDEEYEAILSTTTTDEVERIERARLKTASMKLDIMWDVYLKKANEAWESFSNF